MSALAVLSVSEVTLLQQRTLLLFFCTLLVLVMAFGLALFYLGSSHTWRRFALMTAGFVIALWVLCGYGFSFGPQLIPGFLGNPFGTFGALLTLGAATLHGIAFVGFQTAVAILTVTIFSVVAVGRVRIAPWLAFVGIWLVFVYSPIAYSVFNMVDGWIFTGLEVNDQAGGLVVHVSAGATALAVILVLRREPRPVNVRPPVRTTRTILAGVALIWLGAFGLNVGSEGVIDGLLGTICVNTLLAPSVAAVAWSIVEVLRHGRPTLRGLAFGVVAGIVAITPACNILTPLWTAILGVLAGAICAVFVSRTPEVAEDHDRRDAVPGLHLVGGALGLGYIGAFATGIGWKDTGQPDGLADQFGAALGVAIYAFVVAFVIAWSLRTWLGARKEDSSEVIGAQRT